MENRFGGALRKLKPFNRRANPRYSVEPYMECACIYDESGKTVEIPARLFLSGGQGCGF